MAGTLSVSSCHPWREMDWGGCLEWDMGHLRLGKIGLFSEKKSCMG